MSGPAASGGSGSAFYPWYVAGLLGTAYAVAFVDRQVLNLLVEPIKHTLQITDTQISVLQGGAFVAAYVAMGAVFGRLADLTSRRNLLIFGVLTWCVCTVLCGFCNDFSSLFAARAGIGAAEACLLPAGWSLLSDYFDRTRLPRAMSIFLTGPFVGGGLALIFGGLLLAHLNLTQNSRPSSRFFPWQLTFISVGLPGLLIAILLLTVREPSRVMIKSENRAFNVKEVGRFLANARAFYGRFFAGIALLVVGLYALPAWTPTLLMRVYAGTPGRVGLQYGTATLLAGSLGVLLGPWIARRLTLWYPLDAYLRTAMLSGFCGAGACLVLVFAPNYATALAASAIGSLSLNFALPVAAAALQAATPNRMRGLVTSAYAFVLVTTGLGIAPTLIAMATDRLLRDPSKIGMALGAVSGVSAFLSLPLLASATRHYKVLVDADIGLKSI